MRVPQYVLDAPPSGAAVPADACPRLEGHPPQSRGHVVRVREEGIGRIAVVVPVLLPLELSELRSLVHYRFRHDGPAGRAYHVAVLPVEYERLLVADRETLIVPMLTTFQQMHRGWNHRGCDLIGSSNMFSPPIVNTGLH